MTVETNDTVDRWTISGTGPYVYSFRIFDESELVVHVDTGDIDPVLLEIETHYTVAGVDDEDGGTVTLTSDAATLYAGDTLDIRSNTAEYQPTSIRNQGRFLPEIHEDAFDRLSRQIQDVSRRVALKFGYPDNTPLSAGMALRSQWADKFVYVNADGEIEPASAISPQALTQAIIAQLLFPQTAAEAAASVVPSSYAPVGGGMNVKRFGAVGDGIADDTAAFVRALATGQHIYVPPGTYLVDGGELDITTAGQMIVGAGRTCTTIKKRANGNLVTISASNVTIQDITINNDDAGTLTGYNLYSSGFYTGIKLIRVNGFRSVTSAVRFEGGRSGGSAAGHWTIQSCWFDNTPAAAGTPVVHLGKDEASFYSVLYSHVTDCQLQPSGNPIRTDCCGGSHISDSQIGGWDNNALTGLSTVNTCTTCRVLGAVSIEGANHVFCYNTVGAYAVTFESGSSGCLYFGVRDPSSSITNSGLSSNIILDVASGEPAFEGDFRVNNNKSIKLYTADGSSWGQLNMSAGDQLSLANFFSALILGAAAGSTVSLTVGGTTAVRADGSATANDTRLLIYDVNSGTLKRVSVGAADSESPGFRNLRIPN